MSSTINNIFIVTSQSFVMTFTLHPVTTVHIIIIIIIMEKCLKTFSKKDELVACIWKLSIICNDIHTISSDNCSHNYGKLSRKRMRANTSYMHLEAASVGSEKQGMRCASVFDVVKSSY